MSMSDAETRPEPRPSPPAVVQLQIRMPATLHARLCRWADRNGQTMTGAARTLIAAGLKSPAKRAAP